jgi:hypothetical protein
MDSSALSSNVRPQQSSDSSDSLEIVSIKRLGEGIAATLKLPSASAENRSNKRSKLSDDQIRNRNQVRKAGGQCLNCRGNRSKPACTGTNVCHQCRADGLECIRPTLKDKNVLSARMDLLHQPSPSSNVASNSRKAFVAAIIRDFFDMSAHSFLKQYPDILGLLDNLYDTIVGCGFDEQMSRSRIVALSGPCAFNIFVKTNTVLNNRHVKFIDNTLENYSREVAEIKMLTDGYPTDTMTQDGVQQKILSLMEIKKFDTIQQLEVLRAISSEYAFLVLEEFLRESNIRDCKGSNNLAKKASLLAFIGLTLEQVLDFSESAIRSKTLDSELTRMLRHLGFVLLSYLEPPSALAFPEGNNINICFGKSSRDVTGVFLENAFWYELWKSSSNAIPSHLLQVLPSPKPAADPPSLANPCVPPIARPRSTQGLRADYGDQVEAITRNYMGMNLSFQGGGLKPIQFEATMV